MDPKINFIDLAAQQEVIRPKLEAAISDVLATGAYIMGPQVRQFEEQLAAFTGNHYAVTCGNGTDALQLVLMALGVASGDAVIVPSFTFAATAEVVPGLGATVIFADCLPDTFNMDPDSLEAAIRVAKENNLTPKVVMPVDLFGLAADYSVINKIAERENMIVISDSAQGFGCQTPDGFAAKQAFATTTSFFPAKPLGCYGDGGAVLTDDSNFADLLRSLRVHGKGSDKYDNVRIGLNSRLDTLQAAILIEKLAIYNEELDQRDRVAERYSSALASAVQVPSIAEGYRSVHAQYTTVLPTHIDRNAFQTALKEKGIPTAVYYPLPLHQQTAYASGLVAGNGLPVCESLAGRVVSLPMHPYLKPDLQDYIIDGYIETINAMA